MSSVNPKNKPLQNLNYNINTINTIKDSIKNLSSPKSNTNSLLKSKEETNYTDTIDTINTINTINNSYKKSEQPNCNYPFCNCYKCKTNIERDTKNKRLNNINNNNNNNNIFNNLIIQTTEESNTNPLSINNYSVKKTKANNSILDNCFKEHLKSGLQSVMKRDYKILQIETNESIVPKDSMHNNNKGSPFIGRTTNSIMYPEFIISPKRKKPYISEDLLKIPFSGSSSYKENYEKFDDRYYLEKIPPFLKKDNLETIGKMITETTSKETYKNLYLNSTKNKINKKENYKFSNNFSHLGFNPPQLKDNYLSQYRRAYIFDKENNKI